MDYGLISIRVYHSFRQALFDGIFLMMYNIFYTACPILFYGLLEQPYPEKVLMERPHLYKLIRRNRLMTWSIFLKWTMFALWHASIAYWFSKAISSHSSTHHLHGLKKTQLIFRVFCSVLVMASVFSYQRFTFFRHSCLLWNCGVG
jgi:magnesium-transporting ATPase (P-type)